jgi:3,4-dihydroxy 2-butanone 4-phosphate synthase/GTP cyclohydrolase II
MEPLADPFALRPDLDAALKAIDDAGVGVLLYVVNRGRMRMRSSFDRLVLQQPASRDSFTPLGNASSETLRDFGLGAQVLADLGLKKIRLMIHSDRKIAAIEGFGIEVVERVPIPRGAFRRREAQS